MSRGLGWQEFQEHARRSSATPGSHGAGMPRTLFPSWPRKALLECMEENLSWADKTGDHFGRMRRLPAQVSYRPQLGPTHTMFVVRRGPTTWRSGPLGQGTLAGIEHGDD
jgi:hypothetical protein